MIRWARGQVPSLSLIVLGLLYLSIIAYAMPFDFADEGYLYYVASAFDSGDLPYRDIRLFSYLPGLFYSVAPLLRLPGHEIELARMAMVVLLILRACLLFGCLRNLTGSPIAWVTALVSLLIPGPWHKLYVGLLAVLILHTGLGFVGQKEARPWWRPGARLGFAIGLASIYRIDITLIGCGLATVALAARAARNKLDQLITSRGSQFVREAASVLLAALLIKLPWLIAFARLGVLDDYGRQWLDFATLATRRANSELKLPPPSLDQLWQLNKAAATAWVFYGALLIVGFFVVRSVLRARKPEGQERLFVALWAVVGLPPFAFERPDVAHLTQYSVFFLVPAALLARDWLRTAPANKQPPRAFLCLLVAMLYVGKHFYWPERGTLASKRYSVEQVTLSNGFTYPADRRFPLEPLLEIVIDSTSQDEEILALPFQPGVAWATGRKMAGREVFIAPHSFPDTDTEQRYIEHLRDSRVSTILLSPAFSFNRLESGRLRSFAPRLSNYLANSYRLVERSDRYRLLERCEQPSQVTTAPPFERCH